MVYLDASSCTDKPYEGGEAWHLVSLVALAANMEGIADPIIGGPRSLRAVLHQAVVTVYEHRGVVGSWQSWVIETMYNPDATAPLACCQLQYPRALYSLLLASWGVSAE